MAMILFSLTLSFSLIFCVHTAAPFFSVFIPSCLPCSGSLLTLCFFCNLKYSPLPHNIPFSLSLAHSLSFPDISNFFITVLFAAYRCLEAPLVHTNTKRSSFSLSLLYGFVIIYILPLTISSNHCRIYKCVWHTMKSWNSKKKVYMEIWQWKVSFCGYLTVHGGSENLQTCHVKNYFYTSLASACFLEIFTSFIIAHISKFMYNGLKYIHRAIPLIAFSWV